MSPPVLNRASKAHVCRLERASKLILHHGKVVLMACKGSCSLQCTAISYMPTCDIPCVDQLMVPEFCEMRAQGQFIIDKEALTAHSEESGKCQACIADS